MSKSKAKPKARSKAAEAFQLGDTVAEPPAVNLASSKASTVVLTLPLDRIDPSPFNPRSTIDEGELRDLAASIAEHGLLQPLVVRIAGAERYELIAGHRRLAALKLNGAITAPCIIRSISDVGTVRALQIIENLQRADIAPMDEANAFVALQEEDRERWSAVAIARAIGKSDAFVRQRIALARNLAPELVEKVKAGTLKIEVARTLASAPAKLQKQVSKDWYAVENAAAARARLEQLAVPVGTNAFKLALYDGPFLDPEEGDKNNTGYFADVAQFDRLQKAEAERVVETLRTRKGFPDARLVTFTEVNNYRWADDGQWPRHNTRKNGIVPADRAKGLDVEDVTAIVYLDAHKLVIAKGVVTADAWNKKAQAQVDAGSDGDGDAEEQAGPTQEEKRAALAVLNAQWIEKLASRPDLARRLFVYSAIGQVQDIDYSGDAVGALAPWREHLQAIVGPDDGVYDYYPGSTTNDALWDWLINQDDESIDAMMARLMGSAIRLSPYRGPTGLHRALASTLDLPIPAFLLPPPAEPEETADAEATPQAPLPGDDARENS